MMRIAHDRNHACKKKWGAFVFCQIDALQKKLDAHIGERKQLQNCTDSNSGQKQHKHRKVLMSPVESQSLDELPQPFHT